MFEKKTFITCTADDINDIVREKLAPLTDNPERYKDFECVAEFEWNSAHYTVDLSQKDIQSNFYLKYDRPDIMKGGNYLGIHYIMTFLLEHNIIDEGEYSIDATW